MLMFMKFEIVLDLYFLHVFLSHPGLSVFILVINVQARYTSENRNKSGIFVNCFGNEIYKYFIELSVRKDE